MAFCMGEYGLQAQKRIKTSLLTLATGPISLVQIIIDFLIETQDVLKCLGFKKQTQAKIFFNQSVLTKQLKIFLSSNCLFERRKCRESCKEKPGCIS